ncbi:uncharacterized protein LOC132338512 [Haemorhous mexicanus]|uniref:uncharacterized protein LOC132338512 n=1 Tax=Haemorhous mexicanus TaxID=30427 RepID=UPI0028BE77C2|nr:uncharacterized protein LOC132338512 [Haemorhous mexicanus]
MDRRTQDHAMSPCLITGGNIFGAETRESARVTGFAWTRDSGCSGGSVYSAGGTPPGPAILMEAIAKDMLVGRPRDAYIPVPEESDRPPSRQTAPKRPTRERPKHQRCFCVILLLGLVARGQASPDHYPHQPFRWVMRHLGSGKVLKEITTPNAPSFVLRITDLFPGRPKVDPYSSHATHMYLSYWCPASNPGKSYCNHPGWGYCGHWGCETIVTDARPSGPGWEPQEPDKFLQFTWAPTGCKTPIFL